MFEEDALNVSLEKQTDEKLSGYIRIRSKTQGISLCLGDKITQAKKGKVAETEVTHLLPSHKSRYSSHIA